MLPLIMAQRESVVESARVRIAEVGPRDGLQNEPQIIPTADKVRLIAHLARTGVDEIEVSSFVSPRWVPQLSDAAEVFAAAAEFKPAGLVYSALVPNEQGMRAALDVNAARGARIVDKVAVFTAASETFSQKNTNATIAESVARFGAVVRAARGAALAVRGYVSCVVACPFEGPIAPPAVADVVRRLIDLGVDEIDLGETIGAGTRANVARLLDEIAAVLRDDWRAVTLHLHDTHGRAAECAQLAFERGIRSFDGAVAGLGGCPYASTPQRRAPGNIATDVLVTALRQAGGEVRVELERLAEAAAVARALCAIQ
ncbi:MAG: 3-hydroxy-3-isohexenylglutaryl-CoA/hydroxy-methylglutaryl-CoA lyase [Phycisphaerae bacterium]|nr:3-hydroxy-3-isohexenylglutaryl-CoA/hydroxy-methylglutaryl-CoA lyase [Phycisphaerae bacterium]